MILDICIETGLRISDVLNIKREQIAKTMNVYEAKTKKYKIVELSDELLQRLPKGFAFGSSKFAFSSTRKPFAHINRSTYYRHLKNAATGLKIACSAHSARKLYARNVYNRNFDIYEVQKALNHKYVSTTAAYLDIDLAKLIYDALQHQHADRAKT